MTRNRPRTDRLKLVWKKTNGICAHCGKKTSSRQQTIEHYVPKSLGGGYDPRNLLPLCKNCNLDRGNETIDPTVYYKFAPKDVIRDCLKYEEELLHSHRSMSGDTY